MITQVLYDLSAYTVDGEHVVFVPHGTPVEVVETDLVSHPQVPGREFLRVRTPNRRNLLVDPSRVQCLPREETLAALAVQLGLSYDSLVKAAREGRLLARRSAATWLTTERAIAYAIERGALRPRPGG